MAKTSQAIFAVFLTVTVVYGLLRLIEDYYYVGAALAVMPLAAIILAIAGGRK